MHFNTVFNTLINWRNFRLKLAVQGIVVGLFAGTLVVIEIIPHGHSTILAGDCLNILTDEA